MPIEALPQNTIQAIGSTSVISDPCSVVKELIDNALDASATSLQIDISQNTIDVIQLKDNGHGIPPEDQQYVCKRSFTSKIQTLDDLKNVGGSCLGFRGEALASVAEMSGVIAVSTRVQSEAVGSCHKYGRNGELIITQRTSHPRGTTVRIENFLKHIPVRKQTALKAATRNLTRIKKLLQAYAIAQPSKKFSLKVLKAKNENSNWTYAPGTSASLQDAALKVAGTEVSSCCVLKLLSSQALAQIEGSPDQADYKVTAFLPKTPIDTSKINNVGQYISVDGRPLSSSRGIGQDIVKLFKPYIRLATSQAESFKTATDPFLCLQILCPRGSYDVNIEPAKDDLLFENRGLVLSLAESLFRDHYGDIAETEKKPSTKGNTTSSDATASNGGFNLLMARKPPAEPSTQSHQAEDPFGDAIIRPPLLQRPSRPENIISPHDNKASSNGSPGQPNANRPKRSSFVNPWSISRINTSFQTSQRDQNQLSQRSSVDLIVRSPEGSRRRSPELSSPQDSPESQDLPSPPISRIASGSPVRRRHRNPQEPIDSSPERPRVSSARRADRERDRERYGNGALDTWFQRTTQVSLQRSAAEDESIRETELPLSSLAQERFGLHAGSSPNNLPIEGQNDGTLDELSENGQTQQSFRRASSLPHDLNGINESLDSGRGFPVLDRWAARLHDGVTVEETSDLEKALDFERRKKRAIQDSRIRFRENESLSSSQPRRPISHSPHHSRYLAAKAALTSSQTSNTDPFFTTTLSPHDPRAYFMRNQTSNQSDEASTTGTEPRKLPSSRLPLERIPDGYDLHDLGTTCLIDLSLISHINGQHTQNEPYIEKDNEATAFSSANVEACTPLWDERLSLLMQQKFKNDDQTSLPTGKIDLSEIISKHLMEIDAS
ncbi:hypothetical protein PENANT_c003G06244 [Penicillium antarcticum]|uniref:DNA mismatch repair protein S5 domain-containing protein n=1 Tax=Penicillium antarcticum TaxID=416450 RepID=A0A1V6QI41_9EURO|nr:uncharacterized protein N7508_005903 [Penicillium antarcticum]KAJ5306888.1 hypothetical protein N7508_005903 [Penicillium antarcticum]OQD88891.1 hypothetical protein PENANT_c003G06244 [Penicillium antarcticum]